jgi:hypothetical protein
MALAALDQPQAASRSRRSIAWDMRQVGRAHVRVLAATSSERISRNGRPSGVNTSMPPGVRPSASQRVSMAYDPPGEGVDDDANDDEQYNLPMRLGVR